MPSTNMEENVKELLGNLTFSLLQQQTIANQLATQLQEFEPIIKEHQARIEAAKLAGAVPVEDGGKIVKFRKKKEIDGLQHNDTSGPTDSV